MSCERMGIVIVVFLCLSFGLGLIFVGIPQTGDAGVLAQIAGRGAGLWLPGFVVWLLAAYGRRRRWKMIVTIVLFLIGYACGADMARRAGQENLRWILGLIGAFAYAGATLTFFKVYAHLRKNGQAGSTP